MEMVGRHHIHLAARSEGGLGSGRGILKGPAGLGINGQAGGCQ